MMMGMPNCEEVARRATDYLEGALPLRRSAAVRLHLMMCRHCQRFVDSVQGVARLAGLLRGRPADGAGADAETQADRVLHRCRADDSGD